MIYTCPQSLPAYPTMLANIQHESRQQYLCHQAVDLMHNLNFTSMFIAS